jgi:HNH endonuclease
MVIAPEEYPGNKYRGRYVYEHHLVWWQNTGELVIAPMLIHHVNDQKRDNRFENLEKKHRSAHSRDHGLAKPKKPAIKLNCAWCDKEFEVIGKEIHTRRKYDFNHCSRSCSVKHQWSRGKFGTKTN